jgi:glycosyltransferase involved in cell wall biosynthesis
VGSELHGNAAERSLSPSREFPAASETKGTSGCEAGWAPVPAGGTRGRWPPSDGTNRGADVFSSVGERRAGEAGRPRVAIVTHGFAPSVGGSERYHWFTARALAARADVRVITSDANLGAEGTPPAPPEGVSVDYLPSTRLSGEKLPWPRRLFQALRAFDPDLVWGNHPSPTADLGAFYARCRQRPWVATYHADLRGRRWVDRRYQAMEHSLLKGAAAVLVTTDYYASRLQALGVRPDRIHVGPTGPYLLDGAPPLRGGLPADAVAGPEHPFVFLGALDRPHAYKGLDRLLAAMGRLRARGIPMELWIVGDGPMRAEYERSLAALGLARSVEFLGHLPDREVADRLAAAWALVVPGIDPSEGFGTAIVEAMTQGCPALMADRLPAAHVFAATHGVATYPGELPDGLDHALATLWTDPSRRTALARAARAAAPLFSWSARMPVILDPVERLLFGGTRAGAGREAS